MTLNVFIFFFQPLPKKASGRKMSCETLRVGALDRLKTRQPPTGSFWSNVVTSCFLCGGLVTGKRISRYLILLHSPVTQLVKHRHRPQMICSRKILKKNTHGHEYFRRRPLLAENRSIIKAKQNTHPHTRVKLIEATRNCEISSSIRLSLIILCALHFDRLSFSISLKKVIIVKVVPEICIFFTKF
jgi:hypothetical protein